MKNKKMLLVGILSCLTLLPQIVFAGDASDAKVLQDAKITLVEAIQVAEKEAGGQAYEASIDDDSFSPQYEVNLFKDNKFFEARVDAVSGKLLGVREDLDD